MSGVSPDTPTPNQHAASEYQQPNGPRLRHHNPFSEPIVGSSTLDSIVPGVAEWVTRWKFIADVQTASRLNHWLEKIELVWSHWNIFGKVEGVYLGFIYQKNRISAADNGTVVSTLAEVNNQRLAA